MEARSDREGHDREQPFDEEFLKLVTPVLDAFDQALEIMQWVLEYQAQSPSAQRAMELMAAQLLGQLRENRESVEQHLRAEIIAYLQRGFGRGDGELN
jgi:hypothetical protein